MGTWHPVREYLFSKHAKPPCWTVLGSNQVCRSVIEAVRGLTRRLSLSFARQILIASGNLRFVSGLEADFFVDFAWTMKRTGCKLPCEVSGFGMTLLVPAVQMI